MTNTLGAGGFEPESNPAERRAQFDLRRQIKGLLGRLGLAEGRLDVAEGRLDAAEGRLDDVEDDIALSTLGAWTSWTPVVTQSGPVTVTNFRSRYARYGRTIIFVTSLNVTGSGTGSNNVLISLPVTAAASGVPCGQGVLFDASATLFYPAIAWLQSTTNASFFNATTSAGAQILGSAIFTAGLASGDTLNMMGTYEADA